MNQDSRTHSRFGPRLERDNVLFQLWAPHAQAVSLIIEGRDPVPLAAEGQGFWSLRAAARPGDLYTFDIDGQRVPDPASRFQPEDVGGPSQVIDPAAYAWKYASWRGRPWEETVLYEAHVGLLGGFKGVRDRLATLASLGVTAIELMPIGDFAGSRNWGYDGALPFAPDSAYGVPDDLRALVDEAHGLGLMVFLDVVYNHFGPVGNWLPRYAPEAFNEAEKTPWGAAIDFDDPAVGRLFIENALYWLEDFKLDGLRLDAVHAISNRDWLVDMAAEVRGRFADRHVHLMVENENNDAALLDQGFDAQWNDDFHNVLHVLLTGETDAYYQDFSDHPAEKLARCLAEGFIYQGDASISQDGRPRGQPSGDLPPTAFISFLQNHDQVGNRALGERLTRLTDPRALKAAMALALLCPQVPMLFMGEEVGAREPFLFFTDFHGALADAVREGRRAEFSHTPGFSDPESRDHIPDPNDPATFAASRWTAGAPDADAWRDWVQGLLAFRRVRIMPGLAGCIPLGAKAAGEKAVLASWRLGDGATLTLATNLGAAPIRCDLPPARPLFGAHDQGALLAPFTTLAWIQP